MPKKIEMLGFKENTNNIERFRELITEIDISKYKQKKFIEIVNAVFYELFLKPKGVYTVGRKSAKN